MAIKHANSETVSSVSTSNWIRVDSSENPFNVSVTVALSAGATLTYTVQYTNAALTDETDTGVPFDLPDFIDKTASDGKAVVAPVTGIRLNVTAYTDGTATLTVRQAGVNIYD